MTDFREGNMCCDRDVIARLIESWTAQDIDATIDLLHDDVIYRLHSDPDAAYTGETSGKGEVRGLLEFMLAEWDYIHYEPQLMGVEGGVARIQVRYRLQHRLSGEILGGSKRTVIRLRDGLVAEIDEYEDVALVAAFMRLAKSYITVQ